MLTKFQNLNKHFALTQVFILSIVFNLTSFRCGGCKDEKINSGSLIMEVSPLQLDSTHKTITATFQLTEPGSKVDLAGFRLKAKRTNQEEGRGSELSYQDATGTFQNRTELDELLTHFTSLSALEDLNSSLTINFTVMPGEDITLLTYQIEAFDAVGNSIGDYLVEYKFERKPPVLTLKSAKELYGEEREIKLNIYNSNVETIAGGSLKLQITRTANTKAIIIGAHPTTTPNVYEMEITDEITKDQNLPKILTIDPKGDTRAEFTICLANQEKSVLSVSWQEEEIQIKNLSPFVGDDEVTFNLCNPQRGILHDQLTVELISSNKASFALIEQDNSSKESSLSLDTIIGKGFTLANQNTASIRFKLLNANGADDAQVTVRVKRGSMILSTQTVNWRTAQPVLKMVSKNPVFTNQKLCKLKVKNVGGGIAAEKIKFRLTNDKNIAFKVNKLSVNTTIDTDLRNITEQAQLAEGEIVEISLQQDASVSTNVYDSGIKIELFDAKGTILVSLPLQWVNLTAIDPQLNLLFQDLNKFKETFKNNLQAVIETDNYDTKTKAVKDMITINKKLVQLDLKSSSIYLSVGIKKKKKAIKKVLIEPAQKLIQEINEKIIEFLEKGKSELQELNKKIKNNIPGLRTTIRVKDNKVSIKDRKGLIGLASDDKVAKMHKVLGYIVTIANACTIERAKHIEKEAEEIVKETEEEINKLKKEVDEEISKAI